MAKMKQVFLADDNTEFPTEREADAHNVALAAKSDIEVYITSTELERAQAGLLRKHLAAFLSWQHMRLPTAEPVSGQLDGHNA